MNKDDGLRENRKVRKPTEEEIAQEHQELEQAGWEYVEEGVGKILWKHPNSDYLYPQDAAVTIVRGENVAEDNKEQPL